MTAPHDESEEVDILSDFGPSDTNTFQSDETVTSVTRNDSKDKEERTGFLSTFAGDHNYCCTSVPSDNEETESENETGQSKLEIGQSGRESSPKVIIESQLVGEVSIKIAPEQNHCPFLCTASFFDPLIVVAMCNWGSACIANHLGDHTKIVWSF